MLHFCCLIGGFHYLHVTKPNLNTPLDVLMAQNDYVSIHLICMCVWHIESGRERERRVYERMRERERERERESESNTSRKGQ